MPLGASLLLDPSVIGLVFDPLFRSLSSATSVLRMLLPWVSRGVFILKGTDDELSLSMCYGGVIPLLLTTHQIAYIQFFGEGFVRQFHPALLALLFLSGALAGCLSDSKDEGGITLIVEYEQTNGTVVQSFIDGELVSTTNVSINFDFSKTLSEHELITFGIDLLDGSTPTLVGADSETDITIEFESHGIYELSAFAIDGQNQKENMSILIRIEMRMDWVEYSTFEPKPMVIDPIPTNGGEYPTSIIIDSTVENPELIENISSGREVAFTWNLIDGTEDTCQSRNGIVHDGEFVNWETIHFNTFEVHELTISYDDGQDYINVNQTVFITYSEL